MVNAVLRTPPGRQRWPESDARCRTLPFSQSASRTRFSSLRCLRAKRGSRFGVSSHMTPFAEDSEQETNHDEHFKQSRHRSAQLILTFSRLTYFEVLPKMSMARSSFGQGHDAEREKLVNPARIEILKRAGITRLWDTSSSSSACLGCRAWSQVKKKSDTSLTSSLRINDVWQWIITVAADHNPVMI